MLVFQKSKTIPVKNRQAKRKFSMNTLLILNHTGREDKGYNRRLYTSTLVYLYIRFSVY